MTNEGMGEIESFRGGSRTQKLRIEGFVNRGQRRTFIQLGNRGGNIERRSARDFNQKLRYRIEEAKSFLLLCNSSPPLVLMALDINL